MWTSISILSSLSRPFCLEHTVCLQLSPSATGAEIFPEKRPANPTNNRSRQYKLSCNICVHMTNSRLDHLHAWKIVWVGSIARKVPGRSRGRSAPPPPLIFKPNWGPKGGKKLKKNSLETSPPIFSGSGWPPLPYPPPPPHLKVWIQHCVPSVVILHHDISIFLDLKQITMQKFEQLNNTNFYYTHMYQQKLNRKNPRVFPTFSRLAIFSSIVENTQSQGRNSTIKSNKILSTLISYLTQN